MKSREVEPGLAVARSRDSGQGLGEDECDG